VENCGLWYGGSAKIISNSPVELALSSQFTIVVFITIDFSSTPKMLMFSAITR
jgi:hypothetical protein